MGEQGKPPKAKKNRRQHPSTDTDESFNIVSENTVELLIKKALEDALKDFQKSIQQIIKKELSDMQTRISSVVAENNKLKAKQTDLEKKVHDLEAKVSGCEKELSTGQEQWKETTILNNDTEQYSRRWCLRFHGIPVNPDKDCKQQVIDLLRDELKIGTVHFDDLDAAHRVGRGRNEKPPAIIARFFRRDDCHRILTSRRALKGSGFVITDDLTHMNVKLLNRARIHAGVASTWSWNGSIWIQTEKGHKGKIQLFDDLNNVIARIDNRRQQ